MQHPWLVLELGFRPVTDTQAALASPYGFDVVATVPSARWLREQLHRLDPTLLTDLLAHTVQALQQEIPGLGEVVAYDFKHIYAWVRENNPQVYVKAVFDVTHIPTGDPDCRLGVKKSTNQVQPDGSITEKKESLFGYGTSVKAATDPVYGDVVLANYTLPFNEADVTYYRPLYHAVYNQLTSCERINSQAQALGIELPKVRNGRSVANLNTLIYLIMNVRALQKAKSINTRLLQMN